MNLAFKMTLSAVAAALSIGSACAATSEGPAESKPAAVSAGGDTSVTVIAANDRESNLRKTATSISVLGPDAVRDSRKPR